jgi:hypothetical protein
MAEAAVRGSRISRHRHMVWIMGISWWDGLFEKELETGGLIL